VESCTRNETDLLSSVPIINSRRVCPALPHTRALDPSHWALC